MEKQGDGIIKALFLSLVEYQVIRNTIIFTEHSGLSVSQVRFLLLVYSTGINPIRGLHLKGYISPYQAYNYLSSLTSMGYLQKVSRGLYQITDKGHILLDNLIIAYKAQSKKGYSWR